MRCRIVLSVVVGLLVLLAPQRAGQPALATTPTPPPYAVFSGHVCFYSDCGEGAAGRVMTAKIGGQVCATTEIELRQDVAVYRIQVPVAYATPGCGSYGTTVDFFIDGERIAQSVPWTDPGYGVDVWVGPDIAVYGGLVLCNDFCFGCRFDNCTFRPVVTAFIDSVNCGEVQTRAALPSGGALVVLQLVVLSAEEKPGCGVTGSEISFEIGGHAVDTHATWVPGFHGVYFIVDESATAYPTVSPPPSPAPSSPQTSLSPVFASESPPLSPAALPQTGGLQHGRRPATTVLAVAAVLISAAAAFAAFLKAKERA